jgi:hypothetical protein
MFKDEGLRPGAFKLWVNRVQRAQPRQVPGLQPAAGEQEGLHAARGGLRRRRRRRCFFVSSRSSRSRSRPCSSRSHSRSRPCSSRSRSYSCSISCWGTVRGGNRPRPRSHRRRRRPRTRPRPRPGLRPRPRPRGGRRAPAPAHRGVRLPQQLPRGLPEVMAQVAFARHILKPGLIFKGKGLKPVGFKLWINMVPAWTAPPGGTAC